jgi:hypothetical protein
LIKTLRMQIGFTAWQPWWFKWNNRAFFGFHNSCSARLFLTHSKIL